MSGEPEVRIASHAAGEPFSDRELAAMAVVTHLHRARESVPVLHVRHAALNWRSVSRCEAMHGASWTGIR